jgi:uncharacterized membrane protein YeaQ/YmgE (transglycosylase-associated protein family)
MEMSWIVFMVIGLTAGWLAGHVMKNGGYGLAWDIVVGVIGALMGGILFSKASVSARESILGSLIVATLGAIALLFGTRLIKKM